MASGKHVEQGHAMVIRQSKKGEQSAEQKEFGAKQSSTWKNREIDWYNAERRFIFATSSRAETLKWMKKINTDTVKTN